MNWLNAIPEADRAEIRKNLFASPEFHEAVGLAIYDWTCNNGTQGPLGTALDRAFERHGFKQPHSATSVAHNIMAENTERDRHAARMLALLDFIAVGHEASIECAAPLAARISLAISRVEKEFQVKP